jgi:hypothetical protein
MSAVRKWNIVYPVALFSSNTEVDINNVLQNRFLLG